MSRPLRLRFTVDGKSVTWDSRLLIPVGPR
jgi:hypothetical protein